MKTLMRLLSCEAQSDGALSTMIEEKESYRAVTVRPDGEIVSNPNMVYPKKNYRNFDHFVGVIGKFMPYYFFYARPEPLADLKYMTVRRAFDRAIAKAHGRKVVIYEEPITPAYGVKEPEED